MKLNVSNIRQRLQRLEQYIAELERQWKRSLNWVDERDEK
jgi:hypothetical protein